MRGLEDDANSPQLQKESAPDCQSVNLIIGTLACKILSIFPSLMLLSLNLLQSACKAIVLH